MIDDRLTNSSANNDAPDTRSNILSWRFYLNESNGIKTSSPYAVPARAKDFTDLPPMITYVGDIEPIRDETINYVNDLRDTGIPVSRYPLIYSKVLFILLI